MQQLHVIVQLMVLIQGNLERGAHFLLLYLFQDIC